MTNKKSAFSDHFQSLSPTSTLDKKLRPLSFRNRMSGSSRVSLFRPRVNYPEDPNFVNRQQNLKISWMQVCPVSSHLIEGSNQIVECEKQFTGCKDPISRSVRPLILFLYAYHLLSLTMPHLSKFGTIDRNPKFFQRHCFVLRGFILIYSFGEY